MPSHVNKTSTPLAPFARLDRNADVLVDVHVVPNASRTQPMGLHGTEGRQALRLRLNAPPVDGKANAALTGWLADTLGIGTAKVTLLRGETSRLKQLRIESSAFGAVQREKLASLADEPSTKPYRKP